ncbi:unnamed protein product [Orchesella dallaii]|uniref:Monocarboxylate transporter 10 n=1 Tax=Orchesella dallaii TaxID=48710 RepID=A0ABP1QQD9_9HEXA
MESLGSKRKDGFVENSNKDVRNVRNPSSKSTSFSSQQTTQLVSSNLQKVSDPLPNPNPTCFPSSTKTKPILRNRQLQLFPSEELDKKEEVGAVGGKSKLKPKAKPTSHNYNQLHQPPKQTNLSTTTFIAEFEEDFTAGIAHDLPSELFDVEGNLLYGNIDTLRFGLEEEEFSSDDENGFELNFRNQQKSLKGRKQTPSSQRRSSTHHNHHQLKRQKEWRHHPQSFNPEDRKQEHVFPSNKLASILSSCDQISSSQMRDENILQNRTRQNSNLSEGRDNLFRESVGIGVEAKQKVVNGSRSSSTLRKHSSEDVYHPLINHGRRNFRPKRQFSSRSRSSNSTGTNATSNSGNFSPPSDQYRSPFAPFDRHHSSGGGSSSTGSSTITQHYYPEGGWGYVVLATCTICHVLTCGFQLSFGILWHAILDKFGSELHLISCWLGAVSLGISLLFSPVWVSICKKKSTRLSAVFGGLVASLGCLFTSFASQFHQTFISYGAFLGIGVGLTRDASSLMVGQYFKRKRELVEIIVVSGSGLGIIIMSISIHSAIGSLGWRLGLQAVTVSLILTFFLGTCYRSASLYHPQRRAILHLKNQKRKVKEKGKREDRPPFIDCSCLRSKTLRIILMSSACTAFGIFTPLLSLAVQCSNKGFEDCSILLLHIYIGTSWVIGCLTLGLIVIQKSQDCRVSKQYLCQVASVICGISILALTAVKGTNGMVVFSWVYGASLGGYCYSLKVYTYERARARHFPRAWSFLQSSQAIPLFVGVPLTNYANETVGWKSGYYMSAIAVFLGTACLFLTDVRRRKLIRRKSQNSSMKTCETTDGGASSPKSKRLSFAFPAEQMAHQQQSKHDSDDEDEPGGPIDPSVMIKELTCISEEGLADVDFQDIYFDEWAEYLGECITSCNKVENCLVSEYDPDLAMIVERRARRWSTATRQGIAAQHQHQQSSHGNSLFNTGTTGRLALPGIGTVLEVPLLVAKRLHPHLGLRSHHHQHQQQQQQQQQNQVHHQQQQGECSCGANTNSHNGCNYSRGGNCGGGASTSRNSDGANAANTTRVYQHGKGRGNQPVSHFPAIDEDSV